MYFDGCYFDPTYFDASPCGPTVTGGGHKGWPTGSRQARRLEAAMQQQLDEDEAFMVVLATLEN